MAHRPGASSEWYCYLFGSSQARLLQLPVTVLSIAAYGHAYNRRKERLRVSAEPSGPGRPAESTQNHRHISQPVMGRAR